MTYRPRRCCWSCGRDRDDCGGVSRSGLCEPCGIARLTANGVQLAAKSGPFYELWLNALTDAVARLWGEAEFPQVMTISEWSDAVAAATEKWAQLVAEVPPDDWAAAVADTPSGLDH
jgi:hypothetical protein